MESVNNIVERMETPGTKLHPFLIPGHKYKVARYPGKSFTFIGYTNPSKMTGWFRGADGAQHMFSTVAAGGRFVPVLNVGTMRNNTWNRRKHAISAWHSAAPAGGATGGGSAAAGTRRGRRNRRSRTRRN